MARLFLDQLRRQILHLVTHKEMGAADLVKALDSNYNSVAYHLRLLEDAGYRRAAMELAELLGL